MAEGTEELVDTAEFIFGSDDPVPLTELADSFLAIDRLFARTSRSGARLAVTEIRQGSIVALLAPYVPMMGQVLSAANTAVEVGDFVKRAREGLNAFAGIRPADEAAPAMDPDTAADLRELVKPLSGLPDARLDVAHIKYRSKTKERIVEIEASYSSSQLDRIAVNAARALDNHAEALKVDQIMQDEPELLRGVIMMMHQANSGPAKERGRTGDRAIVRVASADPLPVYFAKTTNDMKRGMVGSTVNPLKSSFMVDVLVTKEGGAPKAYTVLEVHGPANKTKPVAGGRTSLLPGL
ncbi:hypothetical protein [Sphingomonas kyungheensis]|uniref:Uncharacterized protein n=1 Tax=Sphingomonas kyungheensis TaxID=1069987 RepID=A0ABU8H6B5_9SPHN